MHPNMHDLVATETGSAWWLTSQAGSQLGTHALTLYFIGLVILPATAYIAAKRWQRISGLSPAPICQLATPLIIVGLALFSTIAILMHTGRLSDFDDAVTAAAVSSTPVAALRYFAIITHLGDSLTYTILCISAAVLMLFYRQYLLAAIVVMAIGGNSLLNPGLKSVFERVRPLHEHGLVVASGWSFPSGHTSGAVVTYGVLAYLLIKLLPARWHALCIALGVALAFSIGSSRIFVQVHYFSDVVAGFISGTVWLTLCIAVSEFISRRYMYSVNLS